MGTARKSSGSRRGGRKQGLRAVEVMFQAFVFIFISFVLLKGPFSSLHKKGLIPRAFQGLGFRSFKGSF